MNNANRTAESFIVFPRSGGHSREYLTLEDAIRAAKESRVPCDVHAPKGNHPWIWEMRWIDESSPPSIADLMRAE